MTRAWVSVWLVRVTCVRVCVSACVRIREWVNVWAELSCVAFVANARWFRHIDFDKHIQFSCPAYFSSEIFFLCVEVECWFGTMWNLCWCIGYCEMMISMRMLMVMVDGDGVSAGSADGGGHTKLISCYFSGFFGGAVIAMLHVIFFADWPRSHQFDSVRESFSFTRTPY